MDNAENKFFHLFTFDFLIDNNLNGWIMEIDSDPTFDTQNSLWEKEIKKMLEDILKNVSLKIVKNLKFEGKCLN
jgi:hypothetical protein